MDTSVRAATATDVAEMGVTLGEAFHDDPLMQWAFADDVRLHRVTTLFGFLAEHGYVPRGACTLLPGGDGACLWLPPGQALDRATFWDEHGEAFGTALEGDLDRMGVMGEAMGHHHPHEDHWYLLAIGIPPRAQGRGLGGVLLAHTLAMADERGDAAYLEATSPRSRALYERFGFEVTGELQVLDSPPVWPMWRPPHAG